MVVPMREATAGKATAASLIGLGAGAGASVEAAAMPMAEAAIRLTKTIFFISMVANYSGSKNDWLFNE